MARQLLTRLRQYFRLKPFDLSTPAGIDRERNRVALLSMLTNAASKGTSMLLVFAGISWTLPYLGTERFGVWMTVLSLSVVLSFMDLGVGNALTNQISKAYVGPRQLLVEAYTGGLSVMAALALLVYFILRVADQFIPWELVFKTVNPAVLAEAEHALLVFYALFAVQLFSNAVLRAHAGMQKAYRANTLNILLALLAILLLHFAAQKKMDVDVLLTITLLPVCASGFLIFARQLYKGIYDPRCVTRSVREHGWPVLSVGGLFLILQIAAMVGWGADTLVISSIVGVGGVAAFAIAQRLFQFVSQPLSIINAPLWPAYANAHAQGNLAYVRQLFQRSLLITLGFASTMALLVACAAPWAIQHLSKSTVQLGVVFIVLYAMWTVIESVGNALGIFLNGIGVIRYQVIISSLFALIVLPLKISLTYHYGIEGLVFANICAYLLLVALPYIYLFRTKRISV
ncbi:lipopolysaccharide biosynthesis protein [Limnobacter humi]|uniref:Lipopolysaccharide biosynthesis protein n=1 Tax=Limnobacter humi TaxID=1778671 RepID=A0ABT1WJN7_9BURK|nr:lipopolysaccharide biosynthesis protein [Limnobacter humi]MCQ8897735.1 lipopolysaccharide biosynthesis protein [Limnobacter humi]